LGQPKQLVRWDGTTLLRRAANLSPTPSPGRSCLTGKGEFVVVLGAHAERCLPELEGLPVKIVLAENWQEGMAASLRAGIAAVAHCDAALVLLCDQPDVTEAHLTALLDAFEPGSIVASDYGPHLGPPCVFDRAFFPELLALTGDQGARKLLQRHAPRSVPFPGGLHDIDTPADLPS